MWEEITTISEIDTIHTGTLVAKEDPKKEDTIIYKVTHITPDEVIIMPHSSNDPGDNLVLNPDTLFDHGWWMLKEDHNQKS